MSRNEVLERFRARATAAERRRFEELRAASDEDSRTSALELVLFRLTGEELFKIGVTETPQAGHVDWAVAFGSARDEVMCRVFDAFRRAGAPGCASCGHGMAGYYVEREKFFAVQRELIADPEIGRMGVHVVRPRFTLD